MRKLLIGLRTSIKAITLFVISSIIIIAIVMCVYKPIYSVSLGGEIIGYSADRAALQSKIYEYMNNGTGDNVAFVQIDEVPEYKLCFLKRGIETNDDEIYEKVISQGITYYNFYAVAIDNEEKLYVNTFEEAEEIVNGLKNKNSNNVDKLSIEKKYVTEKCETTEVASAIDKLYEAKPVVKPKSGGSVGLASMGSGFKDAGIKFIKPITATITSRFGSRWGSNHKGLDFGAPTGTSIKAAAAGTVTYSGYNNGGYGYCIIISHGNGVQTLYGHCSSLIAKVGDNVSQGQVIAKVGDTGRSYGSHLHFEVRINNVSYNPEYYI